MTTDAAAVPAAERRVATPHGRVFARETPGQDPPVVLLHGCPDDHRIYDPQTPEVRGDQRDDDH
jgi:pimeloyl-ACP methyl ester carboxylesterase